MVGPTFQYMLLAAIFVISILGTSTGQLFENEGCRLGNGALGKCTSQHDCTVLKDFITNRIQPVICSFNQSNVVVCCPINETSASTTERMPSIGEEHPIASPISPLSLGSPCTMNSGAAGECRSLQGCPEANTIASGVAPKLCYFEKLTPIVCCPRTTIVPPPRIQKPQANRQPSTTPSDENMRTTRTPTRTRTTIKTVPLSGERISTTMCRHYAQFVFELIQSPILFIIPQVFNESQCNSQVRTNQQASRVVSSAMYKEFPHMTPLGYGNEGNIIWNCAGSLISDNFVLTAAKCLTSPISGQVRWARVGDMVPTVQSPNSMPIQKVVEQFRPPGSRPRDSIALLKLERLVHFNGNVRPACLHSSLGLPQGYRFATTPGWGTTDLDTTTTTIEMVKQDLVFSSSQLCSESSPGRDRRQDKPRSQNRTVESGSICVLKRQLSAPSSCVGGLGSPLHIVLKTPYCMNSIVGVNTGGQRGCPTSNKAGFFARVSDHIDWIESIVWT